MNDAVVTSARGWLGTRFHHQGRLKKNAAHKGGVDCLGLLVGVAKELNLRAPDGAPLASFDELSYPHNPDAARLLAKLAEVLVSIPVTQLIPGDIVLLRVDGMPQHLAIISAMGDTLGIIHAYAPAHAVVEHGLDAFWEANITAAFRVPSSSLS